jgi:hypothetical protein
MKKYMTVIIAVLFSFLAQIYLILLSISGYKRPILGQSDISLLGFPSAAKAT